MATSSNKKKPSARANATMRVAGRRGEGAEKPKLPASEKARSHGRFPRERALTGEDRPANRAGDKVRGKSGGARPRAQGNPRAKSR